MNPFITKLKRLVEDVQHDISYAIREFLKNPVISLVAVVSLALGIGANTVIFSLIDTVMLKTLPVARPDELFQYACAEPSELELSFQYSALEWFRSNGLPKTFGFSNRSVQVDLSNLNYISAELVSDNYFDVLEVRPAVGRLLTPSIRSQNASPPALEVVISHSFWNKVFAGDPSIIGKSVVLDNTPFNIIGVTPPGFYGVSLDHTVDVWIPITAEPMLIGESNLNHTGIKWVGIMGRAGQLTGKQLPVQADLTFQRFLQSINNQGSEPQKLTLLPAARPTSKLRGEFSSPLLLLIGIVFLVLMIACANIANLLIAKAASRTGELTVRKALGASRWRLIKQLLTESLFMACLGGGLALLVAYWGNRLLMNIIFNDRLLPGPVRPAFVFHLDMRILAFTALLSIFAGILFGLVPALRGSRIDLVSVLKQIPSQALYNNRSGRGQWLLIGQLAISLLLLIIAGSFLRSFQNEVRVGLGFQPEGVIQVHFNLNEKKRAAAQYAELWDRVRDDIKSVPGVTTVVTNYPGMFSNSTYRAPLNINGKWLEKANCPYLIGVTPGFFSTMNILVTQGRDIADQDGSNSLGVALMNETAARKYFGGKSPVGGYIQLYGRPDPIEVIGTVKDAKMNNPLAPTPPILYTSLPQTKGMRNGLRVFDLRGMGDPATLLRNVQKAVNSVDPDAYGDAQPLTDIIDQSLWVQRMVAWLSGLFGLLGLTLACIGEFGLVSYAVVRRTREIGIHTACGASPRRVCWLIWSKAMIYVAISIVVGLVAAVITIHLLSSKLFGLNMDLSVFMVATFFLASIAALAAYLPAHRASRMNPSIALRYE